MTVLTQDWTTDFGLPPFGDFADADFAAAFDQAFDAARADVDKIAGNPAKPDFENTIEAIEKSGDLLSRVGAVFYNLAGAHSNDTLEALQRDLSPRYAAYYSEVMMNAALFARVKAVHEARAELPDEERRVTELYYKDFVRAGALLEGGDRDRFREVIKRLAELSTAFSQNVLAEEKAWEKPLEESDLDGLPDYVRAGLKSAAKSRGKDGYLLTLTPSLFGPIMQLSANRALKRDISEAWKARGVQGGDHDNREIIAQILALRKERAALLGFDDFAGFKLAEEMAGTPDAVRNLLNDVWAPARARAEADAAELAQMMRADGINDAFHRSDWSYYAEKRKQARFDVNEAEIKPYLQLENMIEAAFDCASRLFGLSFHPFDAPMYHPDVRLWEVRHGARHMGVFVGDYFARASKRSGAWCSRMRPQSNMGEDIRPIVVNVCNFAKPPAGQPCLLSFNDARTLFHEFGHALHTLLSDVKYPMISGTSVARDFVELPSQLYEHWLSVPEVLRKHALHAETGAPIPQALVDKLLAAENADQGRETVCYIASAMVDLDFHTGTPPEDPVAAEAATLARIGMPEPLATRHSAPHFQHVFSGDGYSSGYYSYMWSEVMDADAFAAFEETGDAFDPDTAARLKEFVYAAGGSRDPAELYVAFRGAMPSVDALLKSRGLAV